MAVKVMALAQPARVVTASRKTTAARKTAVNFKFDGSLSSGATKKHCEPLICKKSLEELEAHLDGGESIQALRRFNTALSALTADNWEQKLLPVFNEFTFNLESFNPAFTSVIFQVQNSIGASDYQRRDEALKRLVVPLAGEYGMHNGQDQSKTHRELFASWFESMFQFPLADLIASSPPSKFAPVLFNQMMRDIRGNGDREGDAMTQACYAMGYNLAIEYMAAYEKNWMLDSFRGMSDSYMASQGRTVDWVFLEVHAEDEVEHAAIGHEAVMAFVPEAQRDVLERAMRDHDRDFAVFYNGIAEMLE